MKKKIVIVQVLEVNLSQILDTQEEKKPKPVMLFRFNSGELRYRLCPNTHITHTGNSDALSDSVNDVHLRLEHCVVLFFSKHTHRHFCCLHGYFMQCESKKKNKNFYEAKENVL